MEIFHCPLVVVVCVFSLLACFVLVTAATWRVFISRHAHSQRQTIWKSPISLTSTSSEAAVTWREPARALRRPPGEKQIPRLFTSLPHKSPAGSELDVRGGPNLGKTLHLQPLCLRLLEKRGGARRGKAFRRRVGGRAGGVKREAAAARGERSNWQCHRKQAVESPSRYLKRWVTGNV